MSIKSIISFWKKQLLMTGEAQKIYVNLLMQRQNTVLPCCGRQQGILIKKIFKMADVLTVCAALVLFVGFTFLFWFIRRLGILEIEAGIIQDGIQRPKANLQAMAEEKNPFKMTISSSCILG